jgi:hypothetical protein
MSITSQLVKGTVPARREQFFQRHVRPDGKPWSYQNHEYLRDIVADTAPHRVIQKGAQVCITTCAFGELLHECELGRNYGYYITDGGLIKRLVQGKLDPLINADQFLAESLGKIDALDGANAAGRRRARRKGADNIMVKQIGPGFAYFCGLQDLGDAKSISLDGYVLDEVDEVDQRLAIWLRDRLRHSSYQHVLELSQPSVPDWGINARYELSDQKTYLHRCPRCRTWHCLEEEWPSCLHQHTPTCTAWHPVDDTCNGCRHAPDDPAAALGANEYRLVCTNCGARVRGAGLAAKAEWVARHPGRDVSGYRISQLYGPATTPLSLARDWRPCATSTDAMENFQNSVLGLTFAGDKQPLSIDVVNAACGDWGLGLRPFLARLPEDARPLIIGAADIGDVIHAGLGVVWQDLYAVVDLREIRDLRLGDKVVSAWDQLHQLLALCHFSVIDGRPEHSQALALARALQGRLALAYFRGNEFVIGDEDDGVGTPIPIVLQDRTTAIDNAADLVKCAALRLPKQTLEIMATFRRHCSKLVKIPNPNTGRREYAGHVENHFGLYLTYLEMAHKVAVKLAIGPRADFDFETCTIGGSHAAREW